MRVGDGVDEAVEGGVEVAGADLADGCVDGVTAGFDGAVGALIFVWLRIRVAARAVSAGG